MFPFILFVNLLARRITTVLTYLTIRKTVQKCYEKSLKEKKDKLDLRVAQIEFNSELYTIT